MGSIKGFIDWVKGSELEDDYEDEMPRQRNEEPAMDSEPSSYNRRSYDRSYDSDAQDAPQVRRHDRSDKVVNSTYIITPYNVDIMGDLIDELENSGMYF